MMLAGGIILAAALAWLAWEFATAPVVEDEPEAQDDPFLAEEIRAALNSVEGVPMYHGCNATGPVRGDGL